MSTLPLGWPGSLQPRMWVSHGHLCFSGDWGVPSQTQAGPVLGHLLGDHMEGRNSSSSTRALKLLDGTSAVWYILTIFGIYGVIFLFRLASNILRKNEKSLEDIYYSNLTFELEKKRLQSKAARCSSLTISNRAVLQPNQASPETKGRNSSPHTEIQEIP
ncbi:small integral membrane protein 34A [Oryx dammah]|uniref:small integral membrane protein 34A n=1 Tax=Oryx dammah TaxID=59534 RepID=UPI001A9B6FFC|nr:small integral membrane protein 34A [Oryx dammah]